MNSFFDAHNPHTLLHKSHSSVSIYFTDSNLEPLEGLERAFLSLYLLGFVRGTSFKFCFPILWLCLHLCCLCRLTHLFVFVIYKLYLALSRMYLGCFCILLSFFASIIYSFSPFTLLNMTFELFIRALWYLWALRLFGFSFLSLCIPCVYLFKLLTTLLDVIYMIENPSWVAIAEWHQYLILGNQAFSGSLLTVWCISL